MAISVKQLLEVYTALVETLADIDSMPPGVARAQSWHKLNTAKNIVRVAIENSGADVEIREAA